VPRAAWFENAGPDADVVVSTRCRVARSLDGYAFPHRADSETLTSVALLCRQALTGLDPTATVLDREGLADDVIRDLIVGRYVSFRWASDNRPGGVHVASSGTWSVMVNEEDHLRIQAVVAGFNPDLSLKPVTHLAESLERRLPVAHRTEMGYLTTSLSNVGTGMRLGFLLHVPMLAQDPSYLEALSAAEQMGCAVRGAFGEGTRGTGALIQLSNRCTYGPGSRHSLDRVIAAARYLVEREREARGAFLARAGGESDLKAACDGARSMLLESEPEPEDVLRCVSIIRLGMALGATSGDILRTGEWMALAGATLWARACGGPMAERFERVRSVARIRVGLRERV
jgi:protein arginine kinase